MVHAVALMELGVDIWGVPYWFSLACGDLPYNWRSPMLVWLHRRGTLSNQLQRSSVPEAMRQDVSCQPCWLSWCQSCRWLGKRWCHTTCDAKVQACADIDDSLWWQGVSWGVCSQGCQPVGARTCPCKFQHIPIHWHQQYQLDCICQLFLGEGYPAVGACNHSIPSGCSNRNWQGQCCRMMRQE